MDDSVLTLHSVCLCVAVSGGMAGAGGGGWGFAGMQPIQPMGVGQTQNYEALFNSLFPINGMVTGKYTNR